MEINKGIETFDDRLDVTRNNPDRKPFGGKGTEQFNLGSEYDVKTPAVAPPAPEAVVTPPPVPDKITHKLPDGTVIEGTTVDELAANIEKHFSKQAAPPKVEDFDDKPLYTPREFKPRDLSVQEMADILNVMKENPQKAFRMIHEAEYGAPPEVVRESLSQEEQQRLLRAQGEAGLAFVQETENYNPTKKNGKKLTDYLHEKGKPITKRNLSLAFRQLVESGDKTLLKAEEPPKLPADDPTLSDSPPPPSHLPGNMGRPDAEAKPGVDVAKFANMSLGEQKQYFADLRRRP